MSYRRRSRDGDEERILRDLVDGSVKLVGEVRGCLWPVLPATTSL